MAAATVLSTVGPFPFGGEHRMVIIKVDSPANTNTLDTGLYAIESVQITSCDGTALAAADSLSVTAISGGTITFGVAGTGRDCFVTVIGV